jgi:DNA-binding NtrC family response regulator
MSESARILVIDDDESIRKTVSMMLKRAGYLVDTSKSLAGVNGLVSQMSEGFV